MQIEEGATIGQKRNMGSDLACGELIASWDDDDWSAPGRLADQVERLQANRSNLTTYHSMIFTNGNKWWKYAGSPTANLGTSFLYRRDWWSRNRFPPKQIGEDADLIRAARQQQSFISADAGNMMVAAIHPGNTSAKLQGKQWSLIPDPEIEGYKNP